MDTLSLEMYATDSLYILVAFVTLISADVVERKRLDLSILPPELLMALFTSFSIAGVRKCDMYSLTITNKELQLACCWSLQKNVPSLCNCVCLCVHVCLPLESSMFQRLHRAETKIVPVNPYQTHVDCVKRIVSISEYLTTAGNNLQICRKKMIASIHQKNYYHLSSCRNKAATFLYTEVHIWEMVAHKREHMHIGLNAMLSVWGHNILSKSYQLHNSSRSMSSCLLHKQLIS